MKTASLVLLIAAIGLTSLSQCVRSSTPRENRVLVLTSDQLSTKPTHSTYFALLEDAGYELTFLKSDSPDLSLQRYKEYTHGHIILFAGNTEEFGGSVNAKTLTKFVDAGHNVLVFTSETNGQAVLEFLADCGFKVRRSGPVDSMILQRHNVLNISSVTGEGLSSVQYRGSNIEFSSTNDLMLPLLAMTSPDSDDRVVHYAVAMQTKNNARVCVLGSSWVFGDEAFSISPDNKPFASSVTKWAFKDTGLLRVAYFKHHLVNQTEQRSIYTIKQHLYFEVRIEELLNKHWSGVCMHNLQVELVRIDPFVRQTLKCIGDGLHVVDFQIPDVHGVYKLQINHHVPGYSRIGISSTVSIHPLRHNEYERFISSALPYYVTCLSMAIGAFVLTIAILYHKDEQVGKRKAD